MKNKKKILVIAEVFYPEDFLINDLVAEWADKGYEIEVMARAPSYPFGEVYQHYKNKLYQKDEYKGCTVHRVGFVKGYKSSVFRKILNYMLYVILGTGLLLNIATRFDRIFIYQTGPLTLAIPGIIAKKIYNHKVFIWTQDLWPDTVYAYGFKKNRVLDAFLSGLVKFVYKNCAAIFVTSPGFRKRIKKYVPDAEVITAPNWPITEGIHINGSAGDISLQNGFNFTFTGNVGKVQNLDNVILGFVQFQEKNTNARLNIVGDGSHLDELKTLVKKENIKGVIFWGRYPVHTMQEFYGQSDVLLLSLKDDPIYELTIPLKFQTYLTAGKPIFGIIKGDTRKLIEDHEVGLTAPPGAINDIAGAFEKFMSLPQLEQECMGEKAKELLDRQFSRDVVIHTLTDKVFV